MKIGVRAHDFGRLSPEILAERLSAAGVEAVQLAIPKAIAGADSYHAVSDALLDRIRAAFAGRSIAIAVLGCYIDPAHPDEAGRARQVDTFRRGIYCAAAVGAGCIATETSVFTGPEAARADAFDRLCGSLDSLLPEARRAGVTVGIEPVAAHTVNSPGMVTALFKRFEGGGLAAVFDPVNLLQPGLVRDQNRLWESCLYAFGDAIAAVHIKEVIPSGDTLQDCPPGEGVMDYGRVIAPWLREHKPDIALLREGGLPGAAERELAWMRKTFGPP